MRYAARSKLRSRMPATSAPMIIRPTLAWIDSELLLPEMHHSRPITNTTVVRRNVVYMGMDTTCTGEQTGHATESPPTPVAHALRALRSTYLHRDHAEHHVQDEGD